MERIGVTFTATIDEWLDDGRIVFRPGDDCHEFPAIGERVTIHRNVGPLRATPASDELRAAAQPILDRALDVFDEDDLTDDSSFAMPVTLKARWIARLRAALEAVPSHATEADHPVEGSTESGEDR